MPDTNSKQWMRDLGTWFLSPSMRSKVWPAYCKCDIRISSLPTRNHLKRFFSSLVDRIWVRASATNVKRKGDKGSPCRSPREATKNPLREPFIRSEKWDEGKTTRNPRPPLATISFTSHYIIQELPIGIVISKSTVVQYQLIMQIKQNEHARPEQSALHLIIFQSIPIHS